MSTRLGWNSSVRLAAPPYHPTYTLDKQQKILLAHFLEAVRQVRVTMYHERHAVCDSLEGDPLNEILL